jgi:hypothetical protein
MKNKTVHEKLEVLLINICEDLQLTPALISTYSEDDVKFVIDKLNTVKTITSDLVYRLE